MAPVRCMQHDSWNGGRFTYGRNAVRTEQDAPSIARDTARSQTIGLAHKQAVSSCAICARCIPHVTSPDSSTTGDSRELQNSLGKTFFQDHSRSWDNTHQKTNLRLPDFRQNWPRDGEALMPEKRALLDVQLATLEAPTAYSAPAASSSPDNAGKHVGPKSEKRLTPEYVKKLCQQGQVKGAVEILDVLVGTNSGIDKYLFYSVLKICVTKKDLILGTHVHALAVRMGISSDTFLCNHFIRMYASFGKLREAMDVFEGVVLPDAFMWSSIISAHIKQGQAERAIELYQQMQATGTKPDEYVFVAALQACGAAGDLQSGKQMHDDVLTCGMERDKYICNCLVEMYIKCGSLKDARKVFDRLEKKNVVTWTVMIAGYAKVEGMGQEALSLYSAMLNEGTAVPDKVTFVCLLQACANVGGLALERGEQLYSQIKERRLEFDTDVGGSLVNMYTKCGSLKKARIIFDRLTDKNVVTWSAMIAGYAKVEGMGKDALRLHSAMHSEGIAIPNAVTFVCLLRACANVGVLALEKGKQLHLQVRECGLESDMVVAGSLVNMYAKCGSLPDAKLVFDRLREKDLVTWNIMLSGYAQQEGMAQGALNIYNAMRNEGLATPDAVTYLCLLQACTSVGALQQGKQLHLEIRERGFEPHKLIGTSLVKMYAECGRLEVSREVFEKLPEKSLETWTALLNGYAENGQGSKAIQCFGELLEQGLQPDEVTYICLLAACSHAGLVDEGQQYFEAMEGRHGVKPDDRHYTCMVDLLGRSGHLDRAEQMLRASGLAGSVVNWTALLSACKSYGDAELGRRCFDHLLKLQPTVATAYVLLGSIYANAGRWDEVESVEVMRQTARARKKAAKACIEVKEEVHEFTVGEERSDVAATLRKMNTSVKEGGHVPQTQLVLRAVSEQEKEDALCGHAEKLALAYGLLNTSAGSPLVVTKNLRMCNDCHSSTKIMSRVEKREIVVRDGHKVHRFENGICSCQDRP